MRNSIKWTTLALLSTLASGCAQTANECAWTQTLSIGSKETVQYLLSVDRTLLAGIVAHNENRQDFCF